MQQAKGESHNNEYTYKDQHSLTLFNESIFGPILVNNKQRDRSKDAELVAGAMPTNTKAKCMPVHAATCGKRPSNMFERMIKNFEGTGEMAVKKREGLGDQEERGVGAGEKQVFRNLEWKNFITGVNRKVWCMYL